MSPVNGNSYGDYTAKAVFSDGTSQDVTTLAAWTENSSYAYMDSSVKNRMRTYAVTSSQPVTLTASYTYNGVTKSGSMSVTIAAPAKVLSSLSISGLSSVNENSYGDYSAIATFSDGSTQTVTSSTATVWSENSSYASMDSYTAGRLKTGSISSNQSVTVTASYTYNGVTKTASKSVTIVNVPVYSIDKTLTTSGSGTLGSLKMTASLSGTSLTLTVSKADGTAWKNSGTLYFKVGSYESYGANRKTVSISSGTTTSPSYTHNLTDYAGTYPKYFYARFEASSGYVWVGPITVTEK